MEDSLGEKIIGDEGTQFGIGVASSGVVAKSAFIAKLIGMSKTAAVGAKIGLIFMPHIAVAVGGGIAGLFTLKQIIKHFNKIK